MSRSQEKMQDICNAQRDFEQLDRWHSVFLDKVKESIDLYHETGHFKGLTVDGESPPFTLNYAGRKFRFEFIVRPKTRGPSEGVITAYCHWGESEEGIVVGQYVYDPQGNITKAPEEMIFLSAGAGTPLRNTNNREWPFNFVLHAIHKGCCTRAGYDLMQAMGGE